MYQTTIEHFENKLQMLFPNDDLTVLNFTQANSPVTIRCNKCKHVYSYNRGTTLYSSKRKYFCKLCNTESIRAMQKACDEHNLTIIEYGDKVTVPCKIQCNTCKAIFKRTPSTWIQKDCPYCGINKHILDKDNYQKQIDEVFGINELIIVNEIPKYKNITVRHTCGFERTSTLPAILKNKVCPYCDAYISLGEKKILSFLKSMNIEYVFQQKIPNTRMHFDFFLSEKNIAIEYNGQQHYIPVQLFGGEERFEKQIIYDKNKQEYCTQNNIKLIIIKYTEYDQIEDILAAELMGGSIDE